MRMDTRAADRLDTVAAAARLEKNTISEDARTADRLDTVAAAVLQAKDGVSMDARTAERLNTVAAAVHHAPDRPSVTRRHQRASHDVQRRPCLKFCLRQPSRRSTSMVVAMRTGLSRWWNTGVAAQRQSVVPCRRN